MYEVDEARKFVDIALPVDYLQLLATRCVCSSDEAVRSSAKLVCFITSDTR